MEQFPDELKINMNLEDLSIPRESIDSTYLTFKPNTNDELQ